MQNDAGRVLNVIDKIIDKNTKSNARVDVTYGQVYEVSGQECSVYLSGSREMALAYGEIAVPTEGFRIPGIFLVHAEDNVKVSIDDRGHKWIEDVIPLAFPKLSIDPNNGQILTGDGTVPPWIPFAASSTVGGFMGACLNLSSPLPTSSGVSVDVPWDVVEWDTDGISELASDGIRVPVGKGGFWKVSSLITWQPDTAVEVRGFLRIESQTDTLLEIFEARPPVAAAPPVVMLAGSKTVRLVENTLITSSVSFTGVAGDLTPLEFTPDSTMFLMAEYMGPFAPVTVQSGTFTANAVIKGINNPTFTANAVLRKAVSGTFTADAVIYSSTVSGSFTADAYLAAAFEGWQAEPGTYATNHAAAVVPMGESFDIPALGGGTLSWRIVGTDLHGFAGYPAGGTGGTRMIRFSTNTDTGILGRDISLVPLGHATGPFDMSGSFNSVESATLAGLGTLQWGLFNGDNRESWEITITYAEIWVTGGGGPYGSP